ncbi:hypothetical protein D3C78_1528280 [compost metagenome]
MFTSSGNHWCRLRMRSRQGRPPWEVCCICAMSPPEQKAPPAPVRITVWTCASSRICAMAAARAGRMAWFSALRASGRFRVMVPMPSCTEVNTGDALMADSIEIMRTPGNCSASR